MRIRMDDGSLRTVEQRGALATGSRVKVARRRGSLGCRPSGARLSPEPIEMAAIRTSIASCLLAVAQAALAQPVYVNVTAGGLLRPGVYGRIMFRDAPPPPLIYSQPVVASQTLGPMTGRPVYWYLPPGQVRKWATYCGKYAACDVPVYFVRMDDNPGKLGQWKKRERSAERAASMLALGETSS